MDFTGDLYMLALQNILVNAGSKATALVESDDGQITIRYINCEIFTEGNRCKFCEQHRKTLTSVLSRQLSQDNEASIQPTSHTTYHCLTHSQLAERLHLMHKTYRHTKQQLRRLKEKVNEIIEQDGIQLDECMHNDFEMIMQEKSKLVNDSFQPDSFQQLLWK